jgi:predicted glycosyltransferase
MKRVLVAPLDWGLGHTARCIPVMEELQQQGAQVIFAGTKDQVRFVKQHILPLSAIDLFGYNVSYSAIWPQWMKVGFQSLRLAKTIEKEHQWLQEFVQQNQTDIVISDNRFGLYSDKCKSIFISHQLNIPAPLFRQTANTINHRYIEQFDECWVPDNPYLNLSGNLSTSEKKHPHIGILSRFKEASEPGRKEFDFLFLLSGPEPQRSILEKKLVALTSDTDYSVALVRGIPEKTKDIPKPIKQFDLLNSKELERLMQSSEAVVCRSGYSSIMDLALLQKKTFFIPTPGQPEQEYLAAYLRKKSGIQYSQQKDIDSSLDLKTIKTLARRIPVQSGEDPAAFASENHRLLQNEIRRILQD